jgi:hypothetical protein
MIDVMTLVRILAALTTVLVACTSAPAPPASPPPDRPTVATEPPTVPLSGRGSFVGAWRDEAGVRLPDGLPGGEELVLHVMRGQEHCGWQRVVFLSMGWPPGTRVHTPADYHQYVRDPRGLLEEWPLARRFAAGVGLPDEALDTGFARGSWELWVLPGHRNAAYLVNGDYVERWPRSREAIACR